MDAKESLCALLESLLDLNKKTPRALLIDFVAGNETQRIKERNLDDHELFGCGDKHDEDYYNMVLDQAISDKLIKSVDSGLSITAKGKKFLKDPVPYIISEEEEQEEPDTSALEDVEDLPEDEETTVAPPTPTESIGSHVKIKIQLIQAMDRKIALDDFAEQNNLEFDEVLDELEALKASGRKIDINYFVDEVLGEESLDELCDYFDKEKGNIGKAFQEFGDVYEPEEIRLAYLAWGK